MHIVGLGTDLVEVARFRLAMERRGERLGERLFSDDERAYAGKQKDPAKSLSARFGAKEAVMKAMGVGLWKFKLRDVEVARAKTGAPSVILHGRAAEMAAERGIVDWQLSLTHTDTTALAIAIAIGRDWRTVQPILTPAEMAEADQRTYAAGTPVETLMERAGHAVAWEVRRLLEDTYGKRVVVVCGKGNNGGDGVIAARVLRGWGVRTDVYELAHGVPVGALDRAIGRADVFVDAMFGTGFRGALEGDAALVARRSADVTTVAVDIPSGVDGLTGAVQGDAVHAARTVAFAALKPGLVFEPGRGLAGTVVVADIGIDVSHASSGLTQRDDVRAWLARSSDPETHKWKSGLLVIGGSGGMTGAPMMASHTAMRSGAGIVWYAVPGHDAAASASGSEVITKAMPANANGALTGIADDVRAALGKFHAVVIGPGLGTGEQTSAVVRDLVASVPLPLVLDADGINAFAGQPGLLRTRSAPTVITPHEGEFERLLGEPVGDDRVAAARKLAAATGCVGLLKGPGTVIAHPDGRTAVNGVDGPWLGTAGSGDVLTGIIGGFLARGLEAFEAAAAGACVHGLAADVAGHTGLVASDLVAALPDTFMSLET